MTGDFQSAGFEGVETRTIETEVQYADFDDYWTSQTALPNPAVQTIRQMSQPNVERLKATLRGRLADGEGRIR